MLGFGLLVALAAVASSFLIKRILPYISEKLFQKTGYVAMVLAGMGMFFNASKNIMEENNMQMSYVAEDESIETKMQWRKRTFQIDFEYDDGSFEIEYPITLEDLPADKQILAAELGKSADKVLLEEVYGIHTHYYEVYVYKDGKLNKHDI